MDKGFIWGLWGMGRMSHRHGIFLFVCVCVYVLMCVHLCVYERHSICPLLIALTLQICTLSCTLTATGQWSAQPLGIWAIGATILYYKSATQSQHFENKEPC